MSALRSDALAAGAKVPGERVGCGTQRTFKAAQGTSKQMGLEQCTRSGIARTLWQPTRSLIRHLFFSVQGL